MLFQALPSLRVYTDYSTVILNGFLIVSFFVFFSLPAFNSLSIFHIPSVCNDYPWLSTWLHWPSTQVKTVEHACEGCYWFDHLRWHPNSGLPLLMSVLIKAYGRWTLSHFSHLPSLLLGSWCFQFLKHTFSGIRTYFFRVPIITKHGHLSRISL